MWELAVSCRAIAKRTRFAVHIVAPPGWRQVCGCPTDAQIWAAGTDAKCCICNTDRVATCMHCSPGKKLVHIAAPKGPTISSDGKEFFEFSQCRCRCNSSVTHIGSDLQLVVDSLPCGLLTSASFKIIGNSHRKPTKNASSTKHSSLEAPPTQTASPKTPQCILTPHSNTTTPDHTPASVSPPTDTQSPNPCTETTHGPGNRSMVDNHSPSPTPKSKKQLPTRHNRHHQTKSEQPKQRAPNTQLDLLKCLQTISEMQQYHKTQEESSRKRPPTHKAPSQSASQSQTQTQTQTQTHQVKSLMPFYQQIPSGTIPCIEEILTLVARLKYHCKVYKMDNVNGKHQLTLVRTHQNFNHFFSRLSFLESEISGQGIHNDWRYSLQ